MIPNELNMGEIISFTSLSSFDTNRYKGRVSIPEMDVSSALRLGDIINTTTQVNQSASLTLDYNALSYFMIEVEDGELMGTPIVFAKEWITPNSFLVEEENLSVTLKISGIGDQSQLTTALDLLRENGYIIEVLDSSVL